MLLFAKMDMMTTILIEQSKGVQLAKTILEEENKANSQFFWFHSYYKYICVNQDIVILA